MPSASIEFRTISPAPREITSCVPLQCVAVGWDAPAVDDDAVSAGHGSVALDIHADDDALRAEAACAFVNEVRGDDGAAVDAYFFGTCKQYGTHVRDCADAAAYAEGYEYLFGDCTYRINEEHAAFITGGDVVKDEFIDALLVIGGGHGDGVTHINVVYKADALGGASVADIKGKR